MTLPALAGETPVIISAYLEHDGKIHVAAGQLFAHCAGCAKAYLDSFNSRFAIVQTEPTSLLDKARGELIDLPPVSAAPPPSWAPWRSPFRLPYQEMTMLNATDDPPPADPKPTDDPPADDKAPPSDD